MNMLNKQIGRAGTGPLVPDTEGRAPRFCGSRRSIEAGLSRIGAVFLASFLLVPLILLFASPLTVRGQEQTAGQTSGAAENRNSDSPPSTGQAAPVAGQTAEDIPQAGGSDVDTLEIMFHMKPGVRFAGYLAAVEKGFYQEQGLPPVKVSWPADSLIDGHEILMEHVQFGTIPVPRLYRFASQGNDLVIIDVTVPDATMEIMARKDQNPNASGIADLPDMRIGVHLKYYENALLGLRLLGNNSILIPHETEGFALARKDVVDALACHSYDVGAKQSFTRYRNITAHYQFMKEGIHLPEDGLTVQRSFLYEHPDLCQKFVIATWNGWQFVARYPDETLKILRKYTQGYQGTFDEVIARKQLSTLMKMISIKVPVSENGDLSPEMFKTMVDAEVEQGLVPKDHVIPYERFFYPVMKEETIARILRERDGISESKVPEPAADESSPATKESGQPAGETDDSRGNEPAASAPETTHDPPAASEPTPEPAAPTSEPTPEPTPETVPEPASEVVPVSPESVPESGADNGLEGQS